jgi:hypothetical protein
MIPGSPANVYAVPTLYTRGISYAVTNVPSQGARLGITNSGVSYCAPITATSGTVPWSSFNTACWDGSGTSLAGPPQAAVDIEFQVVPNAGTTAFDFCVTSVAFVQ